MEAAGDLSVAAAKAVKDVSQTLADMLKLIKKLSHHKENTKATIANIHPEPRGELLLQVPQNFNRPPLPMIH